MIHAMKLLKDSFEKIKLGKRTVEIRLFDEKRKILRVGDIIEFSKLPSLHEKLQVKILELVYYDTFEDMVKYLGMEPLGHNKDFSIEKFLESMYNIYFKEEEKEFGVLAIRLKTI